jgi:hypothetical protein
MNKYFSVAACFCTMSMQFVLVMMLMSHVLLYFVCEMFIQVHVFTIINVS